jgi:hypothetical protein
MEKVIRDGKVAVLISPGFGAGWYSWHRELPQLLFHPKLVEMVEQGKRNDIEEEMVESLFDTTKTEKGYFYAGGADQLKIVWVPVGTKFRIDEYDGSESIVFLDEEEYITA